MSAQANQASAMYPIYLDIGNRLCVVIGGGTVAERKVLGLLSCAAQVRVVSPDLRPTLLALAQAGDIDWRQKRYQADDLDAAFLAFAATNNPALHQEIRQHADERRILLNMVNAPSDCDFQVPAILRRGELCLSISSGGQSPSLAAYLKHQLKALIGEEYGQLNRLLGTLRESLSARGLAEEEKKHIYRLLLNPETLARIKQGQWLEIEQQLHTALGFPCHINWLPHRKEKL